MKKIRKYIDFSFQKMDLIAVFALILCYIAMITFNIAEIYENSILENMQLIPLLASIVFCFKTKKHKSFFIVIGLILILLFLRELSYGRVIYGAIPNTENEFYPLSHYKYGYLTNILIGVYIGIVALFGIIKKVWTDFIYLLKNVKFPIWTFFAAIIFIILEILGENIHNTVLEELSELVIYCLMFSICFVYLNKEKTIL